MKDKSAQICVPVCVRHAGDLAAAIKRAAAAADLIELRLDCLNANELQLARSSLAGILSSNTVPKILTLRSPEQGGQTSLDYQARRRFWVSLRGLPANVLIDLELDLVIDFSTAESSSIDWDRVICSHHDFAGVPLDLEGIYERMAATPARILKIAVQANDAIDCLPIFRLLERSRPAEREMISIAMGQAGVMTRILGPARGSFLTYASVDNESATAPGQLQAKDLREVFRLNLIDDQTEIFGIMGQPVEHSLSPLIHNAAFAAAGMNAVYIPFQVSDAAQFLRRMVRPQSRELAWNLRGLSVTSPHKLSVMDSLDALDPTATEIGAVNTILVRRGKLFGYNTDANGFVEPLRRKFGSLTGARCAIIGAGGVARAGLWSLSKEGAHTVLFVRDPERARALADKFKVASSPVATASFAGFDILINATPLGTPGDLEQRTAVTSERFRGVRLAYDLVYNPTETRFLREARAAGCETLGGIEMLLAQAVEQFRLWTGTDPDLEVMRATALSALDQSSVGLS
jgi:3-dehydroquinate dehydratase/shikimate dehydrogenase